MSSFNLDDQGLGFGRMQAMARDESPFLDLFRLEEIYKDHFRSHGPRTKWKRVYGGLVISQALAAAGKTISDDRLAHSLHAYFLLPGDPSAPIIFEVDRLRDGRSFSTRYCRAIQYDQTIFTLTASYHCEEPGLEHSAPMPDVPPPEKLETFLQLQSKFSPNQPRAMFEYFADEPPLEFRPVDPGRYFGDTKHISRPAGQMTWFRAIRPLPENPALHQCVLAYASDMTLLDSTVAAHGRSVTDGTLQPASLDHSIWFHRNLRTDDWLLFVQQSPNAGHARGLAIGRIYSREGSLVASVAQEGLIRVKRA